MHACTHLHLSCGLFSVDNSSHLETVLGKIRRKLKRSHIILKQVIVYAAVYLRLRRDQDWEGNGDKQAAAAAARIADLLYPGSRGKKIKESCIQFLLVNCKRDLREVIFVKPLHVRIKLDTMAHPKADNSKGIILTDSSVELNLSLAS